MSDVTTPMLPNALDAEEALLGSILIDPEALLIARPLRPSDFYREAHQTIYATMRQLEDDGLAVDSVTVTTRLERTGQLEKAGGSAYVLGLVNAVPTSQNARYYVHLIQKAAEGRQVLDLAQDLASIGFHSTDPAKAAVRAVETLAARAEKDGPDLTPEEASAQLEVLVPSLVRIDELLEQEFPPTLWVVPDLLPEGLTLLAAKPKLGKSWMALGLALAVASGGTALGKVQVEAGNVLYLALEDSLKRISHRTSQLLKGQDAPTRLEVCMTWPRLDEGGLRLLEVWLQARPDPRLIILDTFAKIRGQARSGTLYGDDYASLESVQALAHDYGVGILVVHHTGKESREDPLDEVNATQGLNGVADNILVLRRERGKSQATLIGDGRELNGIEQTLAFDAATGAWTMTEPPPADQPRTPERAEILDLLKASAEPMSPAQVAKALGKNVNTVRRLMGMMAESGEIKIVRYGKYLPTTNTMNSVNSMNSLLNDDKKSNHQEFTEFIEFMGDGENEPETVEDDSAAPSRVPPARRLANRLAARDGGGTGSAKPGDTGSGLDDYAAIMTPDALQPQMLMPSGLTPARRVKMPESQRWPIAGDCVGVFCQGDCVCGEHLCKDCGCEAGAAVGERPWFYDRRQPRSGALCDYCGRAATVATRWKTPMCERCWLIASRGQGINPSAYQPRPFGPIPGDDDLDEAPAGA